ncbi:MAG: amino acid adenylation domain-containing protein [Bacteroidota bacterium]
MSVKKSDPARKAKLAAWLKNRQKESKEMGITPAPEGESIPLSHGQERLWFLQQLYPENPLYHFSEIFTLEGELDMGRLQQAFLQLIYRHEILRTTFHQTEGLLTQQVHPFVELPWTVLDFQGPVIDEEVLWEKLKQEVRKPFSLQEGPLFRITSAKIAKNQYWLVLSFHHIVVDERSIQILLAELSHLYKDFRTEEKLLPKLSLQYGDFAYWQRKQAFSPDTLSYWKEKLSGELPVLSLPTDFERPELPENRGSYVYFPLEGITQKEVDGISKAHGTTPFVFFLAVYKVFLYRYSLQKDIRVGTPFSNRDKSALEQVMGFFNETQVLRSYIEGDMPFTQVLSEVKETVMEAFTHKNMPFESLVSALNPDRIPGVNPLFQVMFLYSEAPKVDQLAPGLKLSQKHFDFGVSKFDLTLMVAEEGVGYTGLFEYSQELFTFETLSGFQTAYKTLLAAVLENPENVIGNLPLYSKGEQRRLLDFSQSARVERPQVSSIVESIEQWMKRTPQAIAVRYQGEALSYEALGARSRSLAKVLIQQGAGPNTFIGLCAKPSVNLLVGIVGILQAGSAYVPLDPAYPSERIDAMLEDAEVGLVVIENEWLERFSTGRCTCIRLEESIHEELTFEALEAMLAPRAEDQLAYAIFTSGSSGKPKGVPISHKNLYNSTQARTEFYSKDPSCFLLLSSYSFDSSIAGIFWTLCTGGTLVLTKKRIEQDIEELAQIIETHKVSHTLMLPSLYGMLLRHSEKGSLNSLQTVIVAGEACTNRLVEDHFQYLPKADLYNEYGPTEATVWCTGYQLTEADIHRPISIGRPITNMETYVLNEQMELLPIGVPGELYIGGRGLAEHYLKRPELSEERFVSHPFSQGLKLYKSGDLASFRSDGNLLFHGRADDQVKIRGYRVELGEIQDAIQLQDNILEAIVHTFSPKRGKNETQKQLIAYYTAEEEVDSSELAKALHKLLPDYMVPTVFMCIDAIPKLPNGKVNYKKLPKPQQKDFGQKGIFKAAQSPFEQKMVQVWERVLGVKPIGIDQNFFQLGGDSLQSIQLIAETRKVGIPLSPVLLFRHPTIAALALELDKEGTPENGTPIQEDTEDSTNQNAHVDSDVSMEVDLSPEEIQIILRQMGKNKQE